MKESRVAILEGLGRLPRSCCWIRRPGGANWEESVRLRDSGVKPSACSLGFRV